MSAPQQLVAEESRAINGPVTDFEAAWAVRRETGDVWTPRPWVPTMVRQTEGRDERKRVPRTSHAAFEPRPGRDPIAILEAQEKDRLQDLVPLRHARMAESPFAYYRGTPAVMAFDLSETPRTDIIVQASGDAHLSNFGIYASPERNIVFDVERLRRDLARAVGVGRQATRRKRGHCRSVQWLQRSAEPRRHRWRPCRSYREWMARYAGMRLIDVWYSGITEQAIRDAGRGDLGKAWQQRRRRGPSLRRVFAGARAKDVTQGRRQADRRSSTASW